MPVPLLLVYHLKVPEPHVLEGKLKDPPVQKFPDPPDPVGVGGLHGETVVFLVEEIPPPGQLGEHVELPHSQL